VETALVEPLVVMVELVFHFLLVDLHKLTPQVAEVAGKEMLEVLLGHRVLVELV
jgi:hypothetical protein